MSRKIPRLKNPDINKVYTCACGRHVYWNSVFHKWVSFVHGGRQWKCTAKGPEYPVWSHYPAKEKS